MRVNPHPSVHPCAGVIRASAVAATHRSCSLIDCPRFFGNRRESVRSIWRSPASATSRRRARSWPASLPVPPRGGERFSTPSRSSAKKSAAPAPPCPGGSLFNLTPALRAHAPRRDKTQIFVSTKKRTLPDGVQSNRGAGRQRCTARESRTSCRQPDIPNASSSPAGAHRCQGTSAIAGAFFTTHGSPRFPPATTGAVSARISSSTHVTSIAGSIAQRARRPHCFPAELGGEVLVARPGGIVLISVTPGAG